MELSFKEESDINLFINCVNSDDYDFSISGYEELLKKYPDEPILLVNIGLLYQRKRRFVDALKSLNRVIELSRLNEIDKQIIGLAHTNLGVTHETMSNFEGAVFHYKLTESIDSNNHMAHSYLHELKETGDIDHGIIRYRQTEDGKVYPELWYYKDQDDLASEQEILIPTSIVNVGQKFTDGDIIESVAIPWYSIISEIEKDQYFLYKVPWRVLEELIAGAYAKAGWSEVILTPRSGDLGRDIIVTKHGACTVRIFDQVKSYAPNHLVTANDVRALLGTLSIVPNVSKGIITTTSNFAPKIMEEFENHIPYRIELRNGPSLANWLIEASNVDLFKRVEEMDQFNKVLKKLRNYNPTIRST